MAQPRDILEQADDKLSMMVELEPELAEQVRVLARKRGIPYAQLVREWVVDRLK